MRLNKSDERIQLKSAKRTRLDWTPEWNSVFFGWSRKYITENKWRCDPVLDIDDLMQEAYFVFMKVTEAYPKVVEPRHFMAIFKSSLRNHIFTLSRTERNRLNCMSHTEIDPLEIATHIKDYNNEGYLRCLLNEAPEELKLFLNAFNDEYLLEEMRKPIRNKETKLRESFNTRLSKLVGLNSRVDLRGMLKQLLTN